MISQPTLERGDQQAPPIASLLVLTVVTGVVDAISILRLGQVFVSSMTGNVVFLGFAVAGSPGFSVAASTVALGAFLSGAAIASRALTSTGAARLVHAALAEAVLCATATGVAIASTDTTARYIVIMLLALAMGCQNTTIRKLAVPDITTTVLTLTLTGIVSDRPDLSAPSSHTVRRAASVVALLTGAAAGAALVLHTSVAWALGSAVLLLVAAAAAASSGRGSTRLG